MASILEIIKEVRPANISQMERNLVVTGIISKSS